MARTGKTTGHKIIKQLASGTAVTILKQEQGYSQIQFDSGKTAWVLSRQLLSQPIARTQLGLIAQDYSDLLQRNQQLAITIADLKQALDLQQANWQALQLKHQAVLEQFVAIKTTASQAIRMKQQLHSLQQATDAYQLEIEQLKQDNIQLKTDKDFEWFTLGALAVIIGVLFGFFLPRINIKSRRSSWSNDFY